MERERTVRPEGHLLDLSAVEMASYERIARVLYEMGAAAALVEPLGASGMDASGIMAGGFS